MTTQPTTIRTHPARARRATRLLALALVATSLVGCSGGSAEANPCPGNVSGDHTRSIVIVAEGRTAALDDAIDAIVSNPDRAFSAPTLGFGPADPDDRLGVVEVATYDDRGRVTKVGAFDLAGVGQDAQVKKASSIRQLACLKAVKDRVPPITGDPAGPGGDLLRALDSASALAAGLAGDGDAVVIATGLGRSTIDGRRVADLDLTDAGQEQIYRELDGVGMVPDLSSDRTAVRFVDPAADVVSPVSAAGVESFASTLCERIGARTCTTDRVAF